MSHAEVHAFLVTERRLERVTPERWTAFENGERPLFEPPAAGPVAADADQIKLLLLTVRDGVCELVEPLSVNVDEHGFVSRGELALDPLVACPPSVVDGRERFLNRYLTHTHQWTVDHDMLLDAFRLSGVHSR